MTRMTYDSLVAPARERLARSSLGPLLGPHLLPDELLAFLICYSAFGVRMTEPIAGWIRRAGQRCVAIGRADVGEALIQHAREEAGQHEVMIEDSRRLVERWNGEHPEAAIEAEALLAGAPTAGWHRYVDLHEDVIASRAPFAQVAIEYEIEALKVRLGPRFIGQCRRLLGDSILEALTFLTDHVTRDVSYTEADERLLRKLIDEDGSRGAILAHTAIRALDACATFLEDCRAAARALVEATVPAAVTAGR
jgi:hypothetical protein